MCVTFLAFWLRHWEHYPACKEINGSITYHTGDCWYQQCWQTVCPPYYQHCQYRSSQNLYIDTVGSYHCDDRCESVLVHQVNQSDPYLWHILWRELNWCYLCVYTLKFSTYPKIESIHIILLLLKVRYMTQKSFIHASISVYPMLVLRYIAYWLLWCAHLWRF